MRISENKELAGIPGLSQIFFAHDLKAVALCPTCIDTTTGRNIGVCNPGPVRPNLLAAGFARSSPASVCAEPATRHWSRSQVAGPARCWTALSCPGRADAWRRTTPASAAWCPAGRCRRSAMPDSGTAGIVEVDGLGSHNTLTLHTADT